MNKKGNNNFDNEVRYKLYRQVKDIINPSISKKNISNYRIVFDESLLPVRIFYPKKVSNIKNILLYIPGNVNLTKCNHMYAQICQDLALELDKLVIAIDYYSLSKTTSKCLKELEKIIKYLYEELEKNNISRNNITLMGDSTGGNLVSNITIRFINKKLNYITKEILLYPVISGIYYKDINNSSLNKEIDLKQNISNNIKIKNICPILNEEFKDYPSTLVITGDLDPLRDEGKDFYNKLSNDSKYLNITYASHGFINTTDLEIRHEYLESIKEFI